MSDVMSRDDKGRHYDMQNDRKKSGKNGWFRYKGHGLLPLPTGSLGPRVDPSPCKYVLQMLYVLC
jgi:hypothetical protein